MAQVELMDAGKKQNMSKTHEDDSVSEPVILTIEGYYNLQGAFW